MHNNKVTAVCYILINVDVLQTELKQESLNNEINFLQTQNKDLQDKNAKLRTEQSDKNRGLVSKRFVLV